MGFPDPGVWMTFQVLTQEAESYVFKNWECGINMYRRECVCVCVWRTQQKDRCRWFGIILLNYRLSWKVHCSHQCAVYFGSSFVKLKLKILWNVWTPWQQSAVSCFRYGCSLPALLQGQVAQTPQASLHSPIWWTTRTPLAPSHRTWVMSRACFWTLRRRTSPSRICRTFWQRLALTPSRRTLVLAWVGANLTTIRAPTPGSWVSAFVWPFTTGVCRCVHLFDLLQRVCVDVCKQLKLILSR